MTYSKVSEVLPKVSYCLVLLELAKLSLVCDLQYIHVNVHVHACTFHSANYSDATCIYIIYMYMYSLHVHVLYIDCTASYYYAW